MKRILLFVLLITGLYSCNSTNLIPCSVSCTAYYYGESNKIQMQQITLHYEWDKFYQAYYAFVEVEKQKVHDVKKCSKRRASNELERQYQYKFIYNGTWCYFDDVHKLFKSSKRLY